MRKVPIVINTTFHKFVWKMITLWYFYQKLNMSCMIWDLKDCNLCILYGPIKKQMFHTISFLPRFHWKKVFDMTLRKNVLKIKLTLVPNSNQFYNKEPHLVIMGHIFLTLWTLLCKEPYWERHISLVGDTYTKSLI